VPTGNPINENPFLPLFQAIDIASPMLAAADRDVLLSWVRKFILNGDSFYSALKANDTRRVNNWFAWRLAIRAVSSTVLSDTSAQAETRKMLAKFLAKNFLTDSNGNANGHTLDFDQRDALHYHIYDLEPLVELALSCPQYKDPVLIGDIGAGLNFIRPYFAGEKQHIEFVHSTVPFDLQRCNAGQKDYCNLPWNPSGARVLLRIGRALIPAVKAWSQTVVDENYDPRIKLLAAIYGDE
jgi:hypothetical protein